MDIAEVQLSKITLDENDVLLIRVTSANQSLDRWKDRAEDIRGIMSTLCLTNRIVVHDESITFTVLKVALNEEVVTDPT